MSPQTPLLAYFGHHKAASDWIRSIVTDACEELGLRCAYHRQEFGPDLKAFVERERADFLIYPNAIMENARDLLGQLRGFHVVRDPRDMAVSAYFSHLNSHPEVSFPHLVQHRQQLRNATKEEGLLMELARPFVFRCMSSWHYSLPNILELKMEQLVTEPQEGFRRIFAFLGLLEGDPEVLEGYRHSHPRRLTAERLREVVDRNDFVVKTDGRWPGQEDTKSHYRKGVPGDWKNHFSQRHRDYVKKNLNHLLVKLGYEKDDNW
jgi:hypothetical protein